MGFQGKPVKRRRPVSCTNLQRIITVPVVFKSSFREFNYFQIFIIWCFFSILNIVLIILTKLLFGLIYKFLPTASLFSFREYYGQALWAAPKIIKFFFYIVQEVEEILKPQICQKIKNVIPVLQSTSR